MWATELWRWASTQEFDLDGLSKQTYARVLEACGMHKEVDQNINAAAGEDWVDCVCLGSLVNIAGECRDLERVEALWHTLVVEHNVEPNNIAYCARAKSHVFDGKIFAAADIFDEMVSKGLDDTAAALNTRTQVLLIACHSSLSPIWFSKLEQALNSGKIVMKAQDGRQMTRDWKQILDVAHRIKIDAKSVKFKDVLIGWNFRSKDVMKDRPNHVSGRNYLSG